MSNAFTQAQLEQAIEIEKSSPVSSSELPLDVASLPSKSAQIRVLFERGYKQSRIAKMVGCRDQMVSNVVRRPLKNERK